MIAMAGPLHAVPEVGPAIQPRPPVLAPVGAYSPGRLRTAVPRHAHEEKHMSKGLNQKKEQKKKPAKSMKEKKAEKKDKKATKAFAPV